MACCSAGHELASARRPFCPSCRRDTVVTRVAAVEGSLPREVIAAAVDAAAAGPAALRSLATAVASDPGALAAGAPPLVGRLVSELIARWSVLSVPACVICGRTGRPLTRTSQGGTCPPCAHRAAAAECARCHAIKPVAGRTGEGQPICQRCRRHERGHRPCGICGKTASMSGASPRRQP